MSKFVLPEDIQKYILENPEFSEVLESFGETMETYNQALEAMGLKPVAHVTSGSTSTAETLEVKAASTKDFKLTGS